MTVTRLEEAKKNKSDGREAATAAAPAPGPAPAPAPAPDQNAPAPDKKEGDDSALVVTESEVARAARSLQRQRRRRAKRLAWRAALGIGIPTLIGGAYFAFIASSQYESVSHFMIQSAEGRPSMGLETLIGAVSGGAGRDTLAVRDYILSRAMLDRLEKERGFRKRYEDTNIDWVSRLHSHATLEDAYEYFRKMVHVEYDGSSGVLTLRVRAFTPEYAEQLSESILARSEKMVNELSDRARLDQTKLARVEVDKAEKRLTKARQAIIKLQQEHSEFNPEASATAAMSLRGQLQGELAEARAHLMQAKAFMQPDAPKVVALTARVQSLSAQVAEESRRLVNPGAEKGLNTTYAQFDEAMNEKEFAQSLYKSALTSLELARSEAARQHRYLATISKPTIPDEETHPRRTRAILTVFVMSVMLFGIASLLVATVREHARV